MDIHFRTLQFIRVLLIYRPPHNSSTMLFLEEFSLLLEQIMAESTGHLLICGDFNLHVDDPCNIYANRFNEILESCNLKEFVGEQKNIRRRLERKWRSTRLLCTTRSSSERLFYRSTSYYYEDPQSVLIDRCYT